jgi:hypothetical protein
MRYVDTRLHEKACMCEFCRWEIVKKQYEAGAISRPEAERRFAAAAEATTIDRLLDAQFVAFCTICRGRHSLSDPCSPRAATEASVSDGSIEPLKAAITELSEKQQNTLFCWMHDTLDCRRFKE